MIVILTVMLSTMEVHLIAKIIAMVRAVVEDKDVVELAVVETTIAVVVMMLITLVNHSSTSLSKLMTLTTRTLILLVAPMTSNLADKRTIMIIRNLLEVAVAVVKVETMT